MYRNLPDIILTNSHAQFPEHCVRVSSWRLRQTRQNQQIGVLQRDLVHRLWMSSKRR